MKRLVESGQIVNGRSTQRKKGGRVVVAGTFLLTYVFADISGSIFLSSFVLVENLLREAGGYALRCVAVHEIGLGSMI